MATRISRVEFPEIFFGFVSPIGADISQTVGEFRKYFEKEGYHVIEIKVTNVFRVFKNYITPEIPLVETPLFKRYETYISYGDQLRRKFDDNSLFAISAITQVTRKRARLLSHDKPERTVYLIHQFKRKEEIDLLKSVYGILFFQVSIYSRRGARVDHLSREFAKSDNSSGPAKYRDRAESLIKRDEDDSANTFGQRVGKIFHDADFIVSLDISISVREQIGRFCDLMFGSNSISPTHMEYGMFLAKAAALRTLDLSRQVGVAIFAPSGEVVSLGSNEVPKALGGTYWSDDEFDDREYLRRYDSNDQRKREILSEVIACLRRSEDVDEVLSSHSLSHTQFMDALEYGRIVHAEMSAISDAARLGRTIKDGTLYTTTFPCHMCAKHIIVAGISRVIFLEPYPKSLAFDLHSDAIEIEGGDRGQFSTFPAVRFEHFYGITPARYRELFERGKRKNHHGGFEEFIDGIKRPIMDVKKATYMSLEIEIMQNATEVLDMVGVDDDNVTENVHSVDASIDG